MTHDELLELINRKNHSQGMVIHVDTFRDVLRAVVELHRPIEGHEHLCGACWFGNGMMAYPCQTIQAIEKELK